MFKHFTLIITINDIERAEAFQLTHSIKSSIASVHDIFNYFDSLFLLLISLIKAMHDVWIQLETCPSVELSILIGSKGSGFLGCLLHVIQNWVDLVSKKFVRDLFRVQSSGWC